MKAYHDQDWISPKIEVRLSAIHGRGMFATAAIEKGEVVAVWGGTFVNSTAADRVRLDSVLTKSTF